MNEFKIKKDNLKLITITFIILSILITIVHNININFYLKNVIIPFTIMILGYVFLIKKNRLKSNKKAYIYLIPIFLILLSDLIVKIDFSNKFLNLIILPILLTSFFISLTNNDFKITRKLFNLVLKLFPKNIFSNLKYISELKNNNEEKESRKYINVIKGIVIGLPVALILLFLLADADKYFGEFIGFITKFVSSIFKINHLFSNIIVLAFSFIILFSIFINVLKNKNIKLNTFKLKKVNNIVVSTILLIINFVFVLFVVSEISKLTNNFLELPIEYTYAEYARKGFFQLLAVTSINFIILQYYIYNTSVIKESRLIKKLLLILIGFSILLIFNSYYRMYLYLNAYGFTILRLQVILFLTMELVLFGILIKKILSDLKNKDAIIYMIITISFYLINLYLCTKDFMKLIN